MKYYAGIGSRSTPPVVLNQMILIAEALEKEGWVLRSGAAEGADSAFEAGVNNPEMKEIYLPWPKFNDHPSNLIVGDDPNLQFIASQHHPAWDRLSRGPRALHTRNVAQILGADPTREGYESKMVICYTPDGLASGGTGQAIRIARHFGVPVFNLFEGVGPLYRSLGW